MKGSRLKQVESASITQLSTSISASGRESNGEKSFRSLLEEVIGGFHKDAYFDTVLIWQLLTASHESLHYTTHFLHSCVITTMEEYMTFSS